MRSLPELNRIKKLGDQYSESLKDLIRVEVLGEVGTQETQFPVISFQIGTTDRKRPTFGIFGGVHGLEHVGTHIVLAYLEALFAQLKWEKSLRKLFEEVRLVSIPLVNPVGMFMNRRSNGNGVDLNRNAPIEGEEPIWLAGGHRYGPFLPWFRGHEGSPMEKEAQILTDFVEREFFESSFSLALDCHSGFGIQDRLWYPYAKSKKPFPKIEQALKMKELLDRSYPYHVYQIEPQSKNYTTHGDLWDYLFDRHLNLYSEKNIFLPWTLEMGSWQWVRKNPSQIFLARGPFNPIKPHRYKRIMRRHVMLIDFLLKATLNHGSWIK